MFLAAQWLRLHAPEAVGAGLIPDWGTMVLHANTAKREKKKKKRPDNLQFGPQRFSPLFPFAAAGVTSSVVQLVLSHRNVDI